MLVSGISFHLNELPSEESARDDVDAEGDPGEEASRVDVLDLVIELNVHLLNRHIRELVATSVHSGVTADKVEIALDSGLGAILEESGDENENSSD